MEIRSEAFADDQRRSARRVSSARTQRRRETAARFQHTTQRGILFTYTYVNIFKRESFTLSKRLINLNELRLRVQIIRITYNMRQVYIDNR